MRGSEVIHHPHEALRVATLPDSAGPGRAMEAGAFHDLLPEHANRTPPEIELHGVS